MSAEVATVTIPLDQVIQKAAALAADMVRADLRPASPYLTIDEAAEYLRCSRQRIYDLRSAGRLSRMGDGARALVSRAELDAYAARDSAC
jgi:excisionase family DNA binding protein